VLADPESIRGVGDSDMDDMTPRNGAGSAGTSGKEISATDEVISSGTVAVHCR
jgi:hypothetical protein